MHPEHRSIGELAYRLWQARGCPDGTAEQDWLEAEKQLQASRSPPASHLPDVPPANADAKWKAAEASRAEPRVEASRVEASRKSPPRRRSQAKSDQSLPGESKPTSQTKPRNDTAN